MSLPPRIGRGAGGKNYPPRQTSIYNEQYWARTVWGRRYLPNRLSLRSPQSIDPYCCNKVHINLHAASVSFARCTVKSLAYYSGNHIIRLCRTLPVTRKVLLYGRCSLTILAWALEIDVRIFEHGFFLLSSPRITIQAVCYLEQTDNNHKTSKTH